MRPVRAAVLLAVAAAAVPARAEILEEIVANVNGEIITMTDVEDRERELQAALFRSLSGAELDEAMKQLRAQLLVDMINEKLLFQRAVRLGLDFEQVYQSALENIKRQNDIGSTEELQNLVKQQGMTLEEFRDNLLKYNVPDIMINLEVRQKISVSDDEARAYYDAHLPDFSHPTTYSFREIAILLDRHTRAEAREIAGRVEEEAAAGADFEELVERHSEAPSREAGGLVADLPAPEMAPAILEALVPLAEGEVSRPVETTRAVFVLKLVQRVEAHRDPFEEARPQIDAAVMRAKFEQERDDYLRNLWRDNWICVFPRYEKKYPTDRYAPPTLCT
jgi:peptidyl-prolyl cis-trans isomerase SurA